MAVQSSGMSGTIGRRRTGRKESVRGASLSVGVADVPVVILALALGVAAFCGLGALIGRAVSSEDGAIAVSNGVGCPMLFLADTFVAPETLGMGAPVVEVLPLTYFSRAVRGATFTGEPTAGALVILAGFAFALFGLGAYFLPWQD